MGPDDPAADQVLAGTVENPETKAADPFDEIDFGSYFDDYLDPGYKSPASEISEKPSFETFLSSPVTLTDHLHSQLALIALPEDVRDAAEGIIGNLDENGYLTSTSEEIATAEGHEPAVMAEALRVVHTLDPAGVGAADLRECLMLQVESRNGPPAWSTSRAKPAPSLSSHGCTQSRARTSLRHGLGLFQDHRGDHRPGGGPTWTNSASYHAPKHHHKRRYRRCDP